MMWSLKKEEAFTKQPSEGGRPAVECGGWQPRAVGCGSRGQRPGSREVALDVKSWLGGLQCQAQEWPDPGGPVR